MTPPFKILSYHALLIAHHLSIKIISLNVRLNKAKINFKELIINR